MISVCFAQETTLSYDDGTTKKFLPFDPTQRGDQTVLDPHRVYLLLEEALQAVAADCLRSGRAQPTQFSQNIFKSLPKAPVHVAQYFKGHPLATQNSASIPQRPGGPFRRTRIGRIH